MARFWSSGRPTVALALTSRHVAGVRMEGRPGRLAIGAHAVEALAERVLRPGLAPGNVLDQGDASEAVGRVLDALGPQPSPVALVIPDAAVKVGFVAVDHVPARAEDLERLLRWHLRKSSPFDIDQAQVGYVRSGRGDGQASSFAVVAAAHTVIREYEAVVERAGGSVSLVTSSTFGLVNAALAASPSPRGDWVLVHEGPDAVSLAVMRGELLLYLRTAATDGPHQALQQVRTYYQDRLGGGDLRTVVLAPPGTGSGTGPEAGWADGDLPDDVARVDLQRAVSFRDRIEASAALTSALAPLVGALAGGARA